MIFLYKLIEINNLERIFHNFYLIKINYYEGQIQGGQAGSWPPLSPSSKTLYIYIYVE